MSQEIRDVSFFENGHKEYLMTSKEAMNFLGIKSTKFYRIIKHSKQNHIPVVRLGKDLKFPYWRLKDWKKMNNELLKDWRGKCRGVQELLDNLPVAPIPIDIQGAPKKEDLTNPSYYNVEGASQPIEDMKALMTPEQFEGFLWGNIIKYSKRFGRKGDKILTLGKIIWYAERLKTHLEKERDVNGHD